MTSTLVLRYLLMGYLFICIQGTITEKPVITMDSDPKAGFNIKLNCRFVADTNCTCTVKWYANETMLTQGPRYTIQGTLLQFKVEKSDRYNNFSCEVVDESNSLRSEALQLQPKYPATAIILDTYTCNRSQIVTLRCEAHGNPPTYIFGDWVHYVNNTVIQILRGRDQGSVSTLKITRCNYQDAGKYQCTVRNGVPYSNDREVSREHTQLKVNDIPVISGHSVINFTNGFDIMVSYYSYPKDNNHHLYLGDVVLVPIVSISNAVIPLLFHRTVASIDGKVMIITVHNAGIYRYSIQNGHGTTVGTIDVWNSKTEESTTAPVISESSSCSFMSLGYDLQVVIIVVSGIVLCIIVLAVAMLIIYRCGKTDHKRDKTKQKEGRMQAKQNEGRMQAKQNEGRMQAKQKEGRMQRRLPRLKSELDDGNTEVQYDEIDDTKWTKARTSYEYKTYKRPGHTPNRKKTEAENRNSKHRYEDVSVTKSNGLNYDTLSINKRIRKSILFFRKLSSQTGKRMDKLKSTASAATNDNVYSIHDSVTTPPVKPRRHIENSPSCSNDNTLCTPTRSDDNTGDDDDAEAICNHEVSKCSVQNDTRLNDNMTMQPKGNEQNVLETDESEYINLKLGNEDLG